MNRYVNKRMNILEACIQDVRYAARSMRRAAGFTAVALLTLALGVGVNTLIFSALYGIWLSPLRYVGPDQLVDISMQQLQGHRLMGGTSSANLADWKRQTNLIDALGVHRSLYQVNVTGDGAAEEVFAHRVSSNLFPLLGVKPLVGHSIEPVADRSTGPREALISFAWWKRYFGGDLNIVGRGMRVDDEPYTIAGVMPRRFEFPPMGSPAYRPVIWLSLNLSAEQENARDQHSLAVTARLKPGVSIQRAQQGMDIIAAHLAKAYLHEDGGWGIKVTGLDDVKQLEAVRPSLVLVMVAASLILLIANVNIANLLLARAVDRDQEMAVRWALGVTWHRLMRQLVTEGMMLALLGGLIGVLFAYGTLPLLKSMLPPTMPRVDEIAPNGVVLGFGLGLSAITGLVFGLVPALWVRRTCLSVSRQIGSPRHYASRILVITEVGLALVLLSGAGLLIESFWRLSKVDLGFQKERVLTCRLQLSKRAYPSGARVRAFREELLRRAYALPGVQYAATVSSLPMGIISQGTDFVIAGQPATERNKPLASYANTSTDYLRAMGIPVVAGRYFKESDGPNSQPVTIVSESLARTWWHRTGALGSRIWFDGTWFTIVGVAKDVRQESPAQIPTGQIYALNHQLPEESQGAALGRLNILVIRTTVDKNAMIEEIRHLVARIDPNQPVAAIATMEQVVESNLAARRFNTLLLGSFAGLAVALAAVGVFGVTSYVVARRTKEIGIRMALGASPGSVLRMVTLETLALATGGAAVGLVGALATSRLLAGFLYGVRPAEPIILGSVAAALIAIVAASSFFPAKRAMCVDPMAALREN